MASESVRIDELRLRIPGLSLEEARRLGDEVAHRVANGLEDHGRIEQLGALDLRLHIPAGTPRAQLAQRIAQIILSTLS